MKLGKRERLARKEQMRWLEQCRNRHDAVMHPGTDEAACSPGVDSFLSRFTPSQKAKPRVPGGWTGSKARSFAQKGGLVIS
jgi:hypothetical protein